MKTTAGIIVALLVALGIFGFVIMQGGDETPAPTNNAGTVDRESVAEADETREVSNDEHLSGANIGETLDATDKEQVTVSIDDFIYEPTILTVKKGTVVTWVNDGSVRHNVQSTTTSEKQGLNSELLSTGDSYTFTFDEVGTYQYFCTPHPTQMRAVVEVVE